MEELLKKLGITETEDVGVILSELEKKQSEYLDRLNNVEEEKRRKQLEGELKEIEATITALSWFGKQEQTEQTGIRRDEEDEAGAIEDLKGQKAEESAEELRAMTWNRQDTLYQEACNLLDMQETVKGIEKMRQLAESGYTPAQLSLADIYWNGVGVEVDVAESAKWAELAAEQGDAVAQFNIGVMYHTGDGVEQNQEKARYYFTLAAEQGYAQAQLAIAEMYEGGKDIEFNAELAMRWYRAAADQNNKDGLCEMGCVYERGIIVPKDIGQAVKWYEKAARQGSECAWGYLGQIYANTDMKDRANFCYQKGVDGGDSFSAIQLAYRIIKGYCGEVDYDKAIRLLEMAWEGGIPDAYLLMGEVYEDEEGGRYDRQKALNYYRLAADRGCEKAAEKLR